jgi:hypothetical protein
MAEMLPSFRSGLLALVAPLVLGAVVPAALAAAAPPREGSASEPTRKERIEEIWLDARGQSGWVRTVPLYLDDQPAAYRFGPAFCGRNHRVGAETLRALHAALAQGQPVRIDAEASGDEGRRCITGVAFFAP